MYGVCSPRPRCFTPTAMLTNIAQNSSTCMDVIYLWQEMHKNTARLLFLMVELSYRRTSATSICHQLLPTRMEKTTSLPMASVDWLPSRLLSYCAASHMANVVREIAKLKEASGDGHPADEDIFYGLQYVFPR